LRQLQERLPEGTPMPERTIWTFIAHVASGLAHLHSKGIVHLDIKPENVFIASASDGACLKIGDFGLAADFTSSSPQQLALSHQRQQQQQQQQHQHVSSFPLSHDSMPFGGTNSATNNNNGAAAVPSSSSDCSFAMNVSVSSSDCGDADDNENEGDSRFMALELLSQGGRAPAADVFSLGMSAFEMAWDIAAPAEGEPWRDVREGRLPPLPPHCNPSNRSLDLLTLVSAMLRPEPSTRPTAAEIYSLPQVQYVLANGPDPLLAFHSKEIDEARNGGGSSGIAAARLHTAHHQNKQQPDSTSVLPSLLAVPKNNASVPALVSALASAAALGESNKPSNVMMGRSSSYREEDEKDEDKSSGLVARISGATSVGGGGGESRLGGTASAPLHAQIQLSRTLESPSAAALVHHQQPAALIRGRTLFVTNNDNDEEETVESVADANNHQQEDDQADVSETSIINKEEHGPDNVFFQSSQPSDAGIEGNEISSSSSSSSAASMMTESDLLSNNNRLRLRRAIDFVNESTDIFVASSSSPTTETAAAAALPPTRIVSNAGIFEQQMSSSSSSSTTSFFPSIPPPLGSQSLQGQASKQPQQPALSAQPPALFKPYSVSARKHPRDYDKHQSSSSTSSSSSSSLFAPAPFGGAFSFASPKATATAHPMAAPSSIGALDMRSLQAQMPSATPGRGTRARTQRKRGGVMQAQGLTNTLGRIDSPTPHQQQLVNDSIADGSESGFISSQPLSAISSTSSSNSSSQQTNTATGSHMMSSVSSSEDGSGGGIRIFNPQQASNILINNEDSTSRFRTSSPDFASSSAGGSSYPRNVSTGATGAAHSNSNSEFRLDESAVSYNPHDESIMSNSAVDTAFFSTRKVPLHYFASAQTSSNSLSINVNTGGGGGTSWHASGAPSPSEGGVTPIAKRERVGSSPITSHMQPSSLSSTTAMSNTISRSSEAHAGILGSGEYSMHHHQQQQQQHHLMRPTPVLAASSQHYLHRPFPTPLPSSSSSLLGGYDHNASHHMQLATHKVWGGGKGNQRGDDSAAPMSIVAPSAHHHHLLHSNFASSSSSDRMETSHTEGDKVIIGGGGLSLRVDAPAAAAAAMQLKWDTDDDFEEPEGLLRRAQTSPIQMVTSNSSATSPTATSPKQYPLYPLQQVGGGTSFASRLQQTRSNAIAAPVKSRLSSSSSPRLSFSGGGGAPTPVRDFLPPSSSNRGGGGGEGSLAGRGSAQQRESRGTIVTTDGEQASSPTSPRTVAESSFAAQNNARRMFNAFGTTSSYPGAGQSIDATSSMGIPTLLPIPTRHQSIPLRIQVNMSRPGTAFDGQTTPLNDGFVTPFGQGIVLDAKHWMANM